MDNSCFCHRCFGIIIALFLLSSLWINPVHCDDEEDQLLSGINSFRQSSNTPTLSRNDNANCVADEIAGQLENKQCPTGTTTAQSQLISDYPNALQKCNVDANSTTQGLVLPVCVHDRVATLVLTNYTQSQNARFVNDTKYTGAGIGKEDDWTVLVLTTSTPGGSFVGAGCALGVLGILQSSSLFWMIFVTLLLMY